MSNATAEATITAQNTFTPWVRLRGAFNVVLTTEDTTWTNGSVVTLQRSFDGGDTVSDVRLWAEDPGEAQLGYEPEDGVLYRLGVKTGDFEAGDSLPLRLSQ